MPGESYYERARAFNEALKEIGPMAEIKTVQNPKDTNGIDFHTASMRLGSLPQDYQARSASIKPGMQFSAYITHCGKAVYLHILD